MPPGLKGLAVKGSSAGCGVQGESGLLVGFGVGAYTGVGQKYGYLFGVPKKGRKYFGFYRYTVYSLNPKSWKPPEGLYGVRVFQASGLGISLGVVQGWEMALGSEFRVGI